jgi:Terpene synthase family 2, C-terminal metal binding
MQDEILEQLVIPTFRFPWPAACHPQVKQVEQEMIAWGTRYGLIPDDEYLARVARTRYGYLAARCYPRANRELVQAAADYFLWFFLADDLFVDRVETVTAGTLSNLTAMIDVLDFDRPVERPVYGQDAWLDVCQRLRAYLSAEHFERFATGMRMWAATAGLQILNHLQPEPIPIACYETIRRHTSGMNPCLALSDAANHGPLAPQDYHDARAHRLRVHANNVVCWANDLQSLIVEARQPGQFRNMATLYAAQGRSLQQAVDLTAERVRAEIAAFARFAETLEAEAGPQLSGFIRGLKDWMRGYQDWVEHDTNRYAAEHASTDADDRGITLP